MRFCPYDKNKLEQTKSEGIISIQSRHMYCDVCENTWEYVTERRNIRIYLRRKER